MPILLLGFPDAAGRAYRAAMPVPTYCLWDTLVELRVPRPAAFGFTPRAVREKRCWVRIRPYALAAHCTETPGLAHDLARRRARWEGAFEQPQVPNASSRRDWSWGDLVYCGLDELFFWGLIIGLVTMTVVGLGLAVVWAPLHILRFRRRTRCRNAICHNRCPDCEYELTGIPDEIEPSRLEGLHVGPARCPECGTPWPLLPPPTSANMQP